MVINGRPFKLDNRKKYFRVGIFFSDDAKPGNAGTKHPHSVKISDKKTSRLYMIALKRIDGYESKISQEAIWSELFKILSPENTDLRKSVEILKIVTRSPIHFVM